MRAEAVVIDTSGWSMIIPCLSRYKSPQKGDLRLPGPPSGHDVCEGIQKYLRRSQGDSLSTVSPSPQKKKRKKKEKEDEEEQEEEE
ncbi:hypothetical protein PoB_002908100 [Plakobranchus ocellatus]|uniref:Uncharacterized protein n=1 Tax=Plakobranchus ocellatus TaxID=259542 RepID=A0AAV3ZUB9_9GAST|nr:hypothetical protein PoB_002908100 [Plakobranchus ocellatus]